MLHEELCDHPLGHQSVQNEKTQTLDRVKFSWTPPNSNLILNHELILHLFFSWSFKKYPSSYHCLLKPKLHGSHLIIIFLILLWFKKKVKGMKEKRYPFWVNIQDFLESWEVITSCSIHEVDVRLLMNDWACQTSHSVVVTERQLIVLGSSSL